MEDLQRAALSAPPHPERFHIGDKVELNDSGVIYRGTVRRVSKLRQGKPDSGHVTLALEASPSDTESPSENVTSLKYTTCQILATEYKYIASDPDHLPPYNSPNQDWFQQKIVFGGLKSTETPPQLTNGKICEDLLKNGFTFDLENERLRAKDLERIYRNSELPPYSNTLS